MIHRIRRLESRSKSLFSSQVSRSSPITLSQHQSRANGEIPEPPPSQPKRSRRPKKESGRRETAPVLIFISCLFHLALIAILPCLRPWYWLRNVTLILMFYLGPAVFQMYEKYEKFQAGYFSGASRPWFIRQGCNHRLATTQSSHQWWNHPEPGVISRMIVVIEWNLSHCSKIYKKTEI